MESMLCNLVVGTGQWLFPQRSEGSTTVQWPTVSYIDGSQVCATFRVPVRVGAKSSWKKKEPLPG